MKTYNHIIIVVAALFLSSIFVSCRKDDSNSPSSSSSTVTLGSWRVSYYYDKIKDETSDYVGYTFNFQSDGTLSINHSSGTTSGTWSIHNSNDNGGSQKLILFAGTTDPLNSLNDDWVITLMNANKIELKDDSNNNEVLHFAKL